MKIKLFEPNGSESGSNGLCCSKQLSVNQNNRRKNRLL